MNKKTLILIISAIILLSGGLFFGRKYFTKTEKPDNSQVIKQYKEEAVDENVLVDLKADSEKKEVTLIISGLGGNYRGLEYELSYETDKGPKGTLSGSKPISLDEEEDQFVRSITLGTCSRNVCTYDKVTGDINIVVKLYSKDDSLQILKKTFQI